MEKFHNIEKNNLEDWYKCFAIKKLGPSPPLPPSPSPTHNFPRGSPLGSFVLREKALSPMVVEV